MTHRYAAQQVFSTGHWWDLEEIEPGVYRRVYVADDKYMDAPPPTEQAVVRAVFSELLRSATGDGGRKRAAGLKPPWWRDQAHLPALFSHLNKWFHGEQKDADSGVHPLVHLAWRALAIAYQETYGQVDPAAHTRWTDEELPPAIGDATGEP